MDATATVTLDAQRIKRLKAAGFHRRSGETVTDMIAGARATDLADVATKADIAALRTELKADLSALETRISKWLAPLLLGQAGLIVALVKLLP